MTSFEIDIQVDEPVPDGAVAQLEAAVLAALQYEQVTPPAALALLLASDQRIHELNRMYRDVDAPTDVLSFPAGEPMPGMVQQPRYLGDIVISVPYATRQANSSGHSLTDELQLLSVHGVLHLLGHDHAEAEEKQQMWQAQSAVMAHLGLDHVIPSEDPHA